MNKRELTIYINATISHFVFTLCWTFIFKDRFPNPAFTCIATIIASHAFFWFAFYGPKLGFNYAEKKGRLIEQMEGIKWVEFLTFILFGIVSVYSLIQPLVIGEPEKVTFFSIPLAFSIGAYSNWRLIIRTIKKEN